MISMHDAELLVCRVFVGQGSGSSGKKKASGGAGGAGAGPARGSGGEGGMKQKEQKQVGIVVARIFTSVIQQRSSKQQCRRQHHSGSPLSVAWHMPGVRALLSILFEGAGGLSGGHVQHPGRHLHRGGGPRHPPGARPHLVSCAELAATAVDLKLKEIHAVVQKPDLESHATCRLTQPISEI